MQMLKMISSLVFLIWPLCAMSRLLVRLLAAIVRYVRPTTALTRACYVLLGIILFVGALGAEQDGERNYAIALAAGGVILLILRRIAPSAAKAETARESESPPRVQKKVDGARNIIAVSPEASQECQDTPEGDGAQMPSDLLKAGWTQKGLAVNGRIGEVVMPDDPAATAWSLLGAVNTVLEPDSERWRLYLNALQTLTKHNLVKWVASPLRIKQEVVDIALAAERIVAKFQEALDAEKLRQDPQRAGYGC